MRVCVTGTSPNLPAIEGNLRFAGYLVVGPRQWPAFSVRVESWAGPHIVVDITDARFGRLLTHAIAAAAPGGGVWVQHVGGNQDDRAAVIKVPAGDEAAAYAVERGIVRALNQTIQIQGHALWRPRWWRWWRRRAPA